MPARDLYHNQIVEALKADGWTITHDPLTLRWGGKDVFADLGAEKVISAEKGARKIAVEAKSFLGPSLTQDLELALGQYTLYRNILERIEPDRELFLAVDEDAYREVFQEPLGQLVVEANRLRVMVFSSSARQITSWIPSSPTAPSSAGS